MDIKIGLLVKNRISVQDVVAHSRTLGSMRNAGGGTGTGSGLQRKETFYAGVHPVDANDARGMGTLQRVQQLMTKLMM